MDAETVGLIVAALTALGAGGGATHVVHRRRARSNGGIGPTATEEVLRQQLQEQRHEETMRVLGDVAETSSNACSASKDAAEAARAAATATERIAIVVEERLPRR